mmetsp:Transcript_30494/g.46187  ORF Transcript_30494/g.46187 Transcript_30494/m.46187 type:complete len:204 (+) Transcript_30494:338-949(+)
MHLIRRRRALSPLPSYQCRRHQLLPKLHVHMLQMLSERVLRQDLLGTSSLLRLPLLESSNDLTLEEARWTIGLKLLSPSFLAYSLALFRQHCCPLRHPSSHVEIFVRVSVFGFHAIPSDIAVWQSTKYRKPPLVPHILQRLWMSVPLHIQAPARHIHPIGPAQKETWIWPERLATVFLHKDCHDSPTTPHHPPRTCRHVAGVV